MGELPRSDAVRRAGVAVGLVCALAACEHAQPFGAPPAEPNVPFGTAFPRQLTFSTGANRSPAWLPDGQGIIYSYQLPQPDGDQCLGILPAEGGHLLRSICHVPPALDADSTNILTAPALGPDSALAYLRTSQALGARAPNSTELVIATLGDPQPGRVALRVPYTGPDSLLDVDVSQLRWVDAHTLVYVVVAAIYADTSAVPVELSTIDVSTTPATITVLPGTAGASSVAVDSGGAIYYTLGGDSRVYRYRAGGAPDTLYDFGDVRRREPGAGARSGARGVRGRLAPQGGPRHRRRRRRVRSQLDGRGAGALALGHAGGGGGVHRRLLARPLAAGGAVTRRRLRSAALLPAAGLALAVAGAAPLAAQTTGSIEGLVRDQASQAPLHATQLLLDGRLAALADSSGAYEVRGVHSGWHRVTARLIGYATVTRDSVLVRSGETTKLDFALQSEAVQLGALTVQTTPDAVLDPLATATVQHISSDDLRHLPVSTLEEAVALSAGAVGESYRGGRVGEQSFIIDGLGLKNQLDASTGTLGVNVPPDILTEASLVTNGFSARYGQALSGLINVVTKDGGERWQGRAAYETDRGLGQALDHGLDRAVFEADGPLPLGIGLVGVVDATGRLDADPVERARAHRPARPAHGPAEHAAAQRRAGNRRRGQAHRAVRVAADAAPVRAALRRPAAAVRPGVQVRPVVRAGAAAHREPAERASAAGVAAHLGHVHPGRSQGRVLLARIRARNAWTLPSPTGSAPSPTGPSTSWARTSPMRATPSPPAPRCPASRHRA